MQATGAPDGMRSIGAAGPILVAGLLAIGVMPAFATSVDEIVHKHLEARGGHARIKAIQTLVYSGGKYREPGYEGSGNAFMAFMRPYYRVVGNPLDPRSSYLEGYDGGAWEWYADPGVVVRTVGAAAGATRRGADFEGPLVDYESKGNEVVLGKTVRVGDRTAYEIETTFRDGFERTYLIDVESFLMIGERSAAPVHAFGREVESETRFDDFRTVDGLLFPFHVTEVEVATGKILNEMQWTAIRINEPLPRWWFSPPVHEKTPPQELLERLYAERTDTQAVMWSYAEFRRADPETDTGHGVEFIGYQMMKMADNESALPLLKSNAADHPASASAAFSLGRAYQNAGELALARKEYERALGIDPNYKRAADALAALE